MAEGHSCPCPRAGVAPAMVGRPPFPSEELCPPRAGRTRPRARPGRGTESVPVPMAPLYSRRVSWLFPAAGKYTSFTSLFNLFSIDTDV